ncbi:MULTISPECIES: cytochrome P450 [Myxococcus]|uniref:cytochrome P450 n=1 Tax=Myxococcus TaxID=32 RepID=UPI0013D04EB7|nr:MULTISPECIES: cytochrome P450 [Myxococcus]NVJ26525.1 cytochrome P450 [Myxococcus sp. AM011]
MASGRSLALPPGPRGDWLVGSAFEERADSIGMYLRYFKQYGDIVRFRLGRTPFYLVSHPQSVKHFLADNAANYPRHAPGAKRQKSGGLFTLSGEPWKRHRRLMQPGFHRQRMEAQVPALVRSTQWTFDNWWEALVRTGEPFNLTEALSRVTVSHMAQAVYSEEASEEVFAATRQMLDFNNDRRPLPLVLLLQALPFLDRRRPKRQEAMALLREVGRQQVARRRQGGGGTQDLLTAMMEARDEEGEGLNDAELGAEFFTLFFAGHEATTSALVWTWVELARHPEIEEQVRAVVEQSLGDSPPTGEDLPKLSYLTQVFQEAMRLHPPAPVLGRTALAADRMMDFDVPAGTNVIAVPYVLHRHPEFWEEPERFLPERFSREREQKISRFLYVPFGAGQRLCMGNNLALMEGTLTLAMMVQRYRVSLVPGQPIVPRAGATYHVQGGLKVTLAPARQAALKARRHVSPTAGSA